jgi:monovalent cation:proton antiporter-2 (CPA2) family protein
MPHYTPLISTIVVALVLAFAFGVLAHRLRFSPLVGYLLAGILISPFTPGYVADQGLANELAEIGVILLMFGVGLHFSLEDLLSVGRIAVPGAIAQIASATLLGMALAWGLGWPMSTGFVFGLALSVASTVVLLRAMQERRLLETERGRIAVGWLIVEDIAMVFTLVLLPALVPALKEGATLSLSAFAFPIAVTLGKVAAFIAVMLIVGRRLIPWILHYVAHTGSRELFRLCVLAIALGVAFGAATLFDVSFALGAFFAGMILSESELSQRAASEILPLRDAFRRAVLRLRWDAGRSDDRDTRSPRPAGDRADHRGWKVACCVLHRAIVRSSHVHRAHHRREPGADRRVFIHSRRPRNRVDAATRAQPRSHPFRRYSFDSAQSTVLCRARPVAGKKGSWSGSGRRFDRPNGDRRPRTRSTQPSHRSCGPGGPRPRWQLHQRGSPGPDRAAGDRKRYRQDCRLRRRGGRRSSAMPPTPR